MVKKPVLQLRLNEVSLWKEELGETGFNWKL